MNVETYNFPVYICGCGYRTGHSSNAARHKKVMCGCEMRTEKMEFVLKHEYTPYCEEIAESDYTTIETSVLNEEREQNKQTISQFLNSILIGNYIVREITHYLWFSKCRISCFQFPDIGIHSSSNLTSIRNIFVGDEIYNSICNHVC